MPLALKLSSKPDFPGFEFEFRALNPNPDKCISPRQKARQSQLYQGFSQGTPGNEITLSKLHCLTLDVIIVTSFDMP